ncbi:MAG: GNAT family N-acetyltransferase [Deltaproteobacteria bacterium]|nr:GNAT family N-acetyltransferase [Deltaproteobacteria bacterium]
MIRRMEERDVVRVGEVIVAAFSDICTRHGFPPPFPASEAGVGIARGYLQLEPQECFVAEEGGKVVGSGFLHLRGTTAGIGPITVDPASQSKGVGKELMLTVLRTGRHCPSLRLVQDTFNTVSFPLYSKLGFVAHGIVALLHGRELRPAARPRGIALREATVDDTARIAKLDTQLTGIVRSQDIHYFLDQASQLMGFIDGKLAGYLCQQRMGKSVFLGPAAASDPAMLKALISHVIEKEPGTELRMRFPVRHHELLVELTKMGLRVESLQSYMVRGPWKTPKGTDLLALFPESL